MAPAVADEREERRLQAAETSLRDAREGEVATCLGRALDGPRWPEPPEWDDPDAAVFIDFMETCLRTMPDGERWSCGPGSCAWARPAGSAEPYLYANFHLVLERVERGTLRP